MSLVADRLLACLLLYQFVDFLFSFCICAFSFLFNLLLCCIKCACKYEIKDFHTCLELRARVCVCACLLACLPSCCVCVVFSSSLSFLVWTNNVEKIELHVLLFSRMHVRTNTHSHPSVQYTLYPLSGIRIFQVLFYSHLPCTSYFMNVWMFFSFLCVAVVSVCASEQL